MTKPEFPDQARSGKANVSGCFRFIVIQRARLSFLLILPNFRGVAVAASSSFSVWGNSDARRKTASTPETDFTPSSTALASCKT
jgi:hypothetical protein